MNTRKCTGDFLKDSYSERLESPKNLGGDMWAYKGDYCGTASRLVFTPLGAPLRRVASGRVGLNLHLGLGIGELAQRLLRSAMAALRVSWAVSCRSTCIQPNSSLNSKGTVPGLQFVTSACSDCMCLATHFPDSLFKTSKVHQARKVLRWPSNVSIPFLALRVLSQRASTSKPSSC